MITLSTVKEDVQKSLFKAINDVGVSLGYCVDRTISNILEDPELWRAAEEEILEDKGFVIEIFSTATSHNKGIKQIPRIVINPTRDSQGNLGSPVDPVYEYESETGTYRKETLPPTTRDLQVSIEIFAENSQQWVILNGLIQGALPSRSYINFYDGNGKFLITQGGFLESDDTAKGILQGIFTYEVLDLYLTKPVISEDVISPLNEIIVEDSTGETIIEIP